MAPCSAFQTPSRNITCFVTSDGGGYIRCDIGSGLVPKPKSKCEFDWLGMSAPARGKAIPTCGSDALPTAGQTLPAFAYDTAWNRFGLRCVSRQTGLRCANGQGHGFFLSRERWSTF
jgi:hypothetical protein